jgi:hypothetical protein
MAKIPARWLCASILDDEVVASVVYSKPAVPKGEKLGVLTALMFFTELVAPH